MKKKEKISKADAKRIKRISDSVFNPSPNNFLGLFDIFNLGRKKGSK